jgi:hypothetical protein
MSLTMTGINKLEADSIVLDHSHPRAHDLLWIYAIGAIVEDARPLEILETDAWWRNLPELSEAPARLFTARFGPQAKMLGYSSFDEVARVFEQHYAHKAAVQNPVLNRLFDWHVGDTGASRSKCSTTEA